jgi:hypothetical protein
LFALLFWIDTVCINQDDLDERAQQIPLMRVIYEEAASVIGWLGEAGQWVTKESIRMILELSDLYEPLSSEIRSRLHTVTHFENASEISCGRELEALARDPSFTRAVNLLSRSYFRRLWVIQEVVLASRLLFVCGDYALEVHPFAAAVALVYSCDFLTTFTLNDDDMMNLSFADRILSGRAPIKEGQKLCNLVSAFSHARCSDPRDRIYGFLSLMPVNPQTTPITADYTKPITQIFREATELMLVQEQNTVTWSLLDLEWPLRGVDIPSWVPYHDGRDIISGLARSYSDNPLKTSQKISIEGDVLTIQGSIVDSILDVTDNFSGENTEQIVLSYVRNLIAEGLEFQEIELTGVWQALVVFGPERDDYEAFRRSFLDMISVLPEVGGEPAVPDQENRGRYFKEPMYDYMYSVDSPVGRNLFRSRGGYFGIGPAGRNDIKASAVQPGDCIAIIPVALGPVILRPVEDGLYTLVGASYIAYPKGPPWLFSEDKPAAVPICLR